ncbi:MULTISPECIES: patatin-like phospholipase family protein [unclassified Microbispora]|uniref:patatin-like phospholipase family protein n=1 Tax=unclassified Microbispora TaxID=2614687 RepID=UPI0014742633|nr:MULTISPECIES: patatin-like phospholipase family protein [unclassified Microbispora]
MTTAFILWGGGSLGAAQVGMLRALTAHGIRADMVVGASIGALNGAYYASHPDEEGVEELARLWLSVSSHDVYPVSGPDVLRALAGNLPFHPVRGALRALGVLNYTFPLNPATLAAAMLGRRNYLFDNSSLRRFLERILPIRHLEETRTPLSVLTADVRTGRPVVLSRGPALPALLASTAIPALYPTVTIGDRMLMDGGVADLTTLDYAVDAGADEAYLLAPGFSCHLPAAPSTAIAMALHGYNLLSEQRISASIRQNTRRTRLHVLPPLCPVEVLPVDFRGTADMIERATLSTAHWLERREPHPVLARPLGPPHEEDHRHRPRLIQL